MKNDDTWQFSLRNERIFHGKTCQVAIFIGVMLMKCVHMHMHMHMHMQTNRRTRIKSIHGGICNMYQYVSICINMYQHVSICINIEIRKTCKYSCIYTYDCVMFVDRMNISTIPEQPFGHLRSF